MKSEYEDRQESFCRFVSTGESIARDMDLKQFSSAQLTNQVSLLSRKWSSLESTLTSLHDRLQDETNEMSQFLDKLYNFSERLNSVYVDFYDEYCTTVPPNASPETVERHRQKLEVRKVAGEQLVCHTPHSAAIKDNPSTFYLVLLHFTPLKGLVVLIY